MKIVAFNGSPRKGGNTEILIKEVFKPMQEAGVERDRAIGRKITSRMFFLLFLFQD